jgi:hypothetical protein
VYDFTTSHSRDGPEKFLKGFQGILQGDGYSGYIEIARQSKGTIQLAGCWSHYPECGFIQSQIGGSLHGPGNSYGSGVLESR